MSQSFAQLMGSRVLLGLAEPIAFPLSQRIILNWVPQERRALAMSIIAPAGSVGAAIAPPLITTLAILLSWRAAFIIPGVIGIALALLWWRVDRLPGASTPRPADLEPLRARELLRNRHFWGILSARVISDPVWFFLLFWMPGFFQDSLGMTLAEVGLVAGLPYVAAVIVSISFGRGVDWFAARGRDPARTQLWLFTVGAAIMPLAAIITQVPAVAAVTILILLAAIAQSWFAGTGVLLASRIPHRYNAMALGFIGAVGASSGLVLNLAAGTVIDRVGYGALFLVLACLHPLAATILWLTVGRAPRTIGWANPQGAESPR